MKFNRSSKLVMSIAISSIAGGFLGPQFIFAQSNALTHVNAIGMKFVKVSPGQFLFGADDADVHARDTEKPAVSIRVANAMYVQRSEVSIQQFESFCKQSSYQTQAERLAVKGQLTPKHTWNHARSIANDEQPVTFVTILDAMKFCEWLSDSDGHIYRLPSEAEWEYCCTLGMRGQPRSDAWSESSVWIGRSELADVELGALPRGHHRKGPRSVYSGEPNSIGLLNMRGNVHELCDDWFFFRNSRPRPGAVLKNGIDVVIKGGSWTQGPEFARRSSRSWIRHDASSKSVGFRVVCELAAAQEKEGVQNSKE